MVVNVFTPSDQSALSSQEHCDLIHINVLYIEIQKNKASHGSLAGDNLLHENT